MLDFIFQECALLTGRCLWSVVMTVWTSCPRCHRILLLIAIFIKFSVSIYIYTSIIFQECALWTSRCLWSVVTTVWTSCPRWSGTMWTRTSGSTSRAWTVHAVHSAWLWSITSFMQWVSESPTPTYPSLPYQRPLSMQWVHPLWPPMLDSGRIR